MSALPEGDPELGSAPTLRMLLDSDLGLLTPPGPVPDLDRSVTWVHTTELLDPSRYLRGGELVCTVGLSLRSEGDCAAFADALAAVGASGVCFGVGDGHDDVPPGLLTRCRELGLAVLVAPPTVAFAAVSRYVADLRLGVEIACARTTNSLVPEMISALRRREPVRRLLDRAGELTGGYLLLEPDSAASPSGEDPAVTVVVPGLGTLVWMGRGEQPGPAVLSLVARFVLAAQGELDIEAVLTRERVGQLLSLVERRMLLPDALHQLVAWPGLSAARVECSAWPSGAGALLCLAFPESLVGDAPEVCLMLTDAARPMVSEPLSLPSGHAAPVAIGDLGAAISQARIALGLAVQHGGSVGPGQLSTLDSLVDQLPAAQLAPFVTQLLAPLDEQDRDRGTQHVRTLRVFLRAGASLSDTARELFLHPNTVRHRLSRIHQLTGRDPLQFGDQTAFAVALRAHDRAAH